MATNYQKDKSSGGPNPILQVVRAIWGYVIKPIVFPSIAVFVWSLVFVIVIVFFIISKNCIKPETAKNPPVNTGHEIFVSTVVTESDKSGNFVKHIRIIDKLGKVRELDEDDVFCIDESCDKISGIIGQSDYDSFLESLKNGRARAIVYY